MPDPTAEPLKNRERPNPWRRSMSVQGKAAIALIAALAAGPVANMPISAEAAQAHSWDIGQFYLLPYHYARYSVGIPTELGLYAADWSATAWPAASPEELRVQTTNVHLVRKGGD